MGISGGIFFCFVYTSPHSKFQNLMNWDGLELQHLSGFLIFLDHISFNATWIALINELMQSLNVELQLGCTSPHIHLNEVSDASLEKSNLPMSIIANLHYSPCIRFCPGSQVLLCSWLETILFPLNSWLKSIQLT